MLPGLSKIFLSLNWFCRNVPFDIDEESLEDEFSEYGKINYVKIVINPKTGQPKGKVRNLLYIYKHSLTAFYRPSKESLPPIPWI